MRRAPGDHRQCRAGAASDGRPGVQSRAARRGQSRRGARRGPCAASAESIRATACGWSGIANGACEDRSNIVRFTDGLVRVFTQPFGPIKALRNVGMLVFDLTPAAKSALSQIVAGRCRPDSATGARRAVCSDDVTPTSTSSSSAAAWSAPAQRRWLQPIRTSPSCGSPCWKRNPPVAAVGDPRSARRRRLARLATNPGSGRRLAARSPPQQSVPTSA